MRQLPAVLAISAAVHVGIVAWVNTLENSSSPPAEAPAPRIELVDSAPVEVTLVEPVEAVEAPAPAPELAAPADETRRRPDARPPGAAAISTGASTATAPSAETGTGAPREPDPKHPLMGMRNGRPPRLVVGVPTGSWDGTERAPDDDGPAIESGQLRPDGGGTFRSDLGAVTATIDRDGSVTLKDKPNLNLKLGIPSPRSAGRAIARWYQDDNKPVGTLGPPETKKPILPGDDATGQDKKPDHGQTVPVLGGSFDVTDALMRRMGHDPYASQKLAYLDATRDERAQIGRRFRREQLERATEIMKANLDHAFQTVHDPRALRRALFELWDECAETGPEEVVRAGRAARKLVVGVIRARLPAGSTHAYSADELARLNRQRSSRAPFAPYE